MLFKPTLGQLILGAVMLRPGWMRRYVPAELRDASRSILTAFGFIWRAEIESDRVLDDRVLDDRGREAMAAVAQGSHADILREVWERCGILRLSHPPPATNNEEDRTEPRGEQAHRARLGYSRGSVGLCHGAILRLNTAGSADGCLDGRIMV